jgi:hypothetical protein
MENGKRGKCHTYRDVMGQKDHIGEVEAPAKEERKRVKRIRHKKEETQRKRGG